MQSFARKKAQGSMSLVRPVAILLSSLLAVPVFAQTKIDVWSAMSPANKQVFEKVITDFNSQQKDVKVNLKNYDTQAELRAATLQSVKNNSNPNLIQVSDQMVPDELVKKKTIIPLSDLANTYSIKNLQWFLPQTSTFVKDRSGTVQAFPLMAEAPVLFINRDLFKKAGLNPDQPPKTWDQMRDTVLTLLNSGVRCAYTSSWQSWIHMENTSAIHNVPYASNDNGLKANGNLQFNGLLHVRHLAMLASWSRTGVMLEHTKENQADRHFVSGQCAMLSSGSGTIGALRAGAKFSYGMAPLPYHQTETTAPNAGVVGGSALWVMGHGSDSSEKSAVAMFLSYLSKPEVAANWSQNTGFLPLNQGANQILAKSFYPTIPGLTNLVSSFSRAPSSYSRGFFVNNYEKVKELVDVALDEAFDKSISARKSLDDLMKKSATANR